MSKEDIDALDHTVCPIRYSLDVVGGKWKLPIICLLSDGSPTRYSSIKRRLTGITNMMLSQSLKELESYGMIHRKQYNEIPPKVEYTLTDKGKSLLPSLKLLAQWGVENMKDSKHTVYCSQCRKI